MTLDEAILHVEEVAEENENVANTRIFKDGYTVDEMYCDDTECINAHLSRCAKCAEEHRQLAEWLKDYKKLLEQEPCEDAISREAILLEIDKIKDNYGGLLDVAMFIRGLPSVNPQPKIGHWIADEFGSKCSCCDIHTHLDKFDRPMKFKYCSNCGARMVEPQ